MKFKERQESIKNRQQEIQNQETVFVPFFVLCIDDEEYYHDSMGSAGIKRGKLTSISSGKEYTVEEIKITRNGKEFWRIGKGFYDPSRFKLL